VRLAAGPDADALEHRTLALAPRGRSWVARQDALAAAVGAA